jgi:hypothetical protein
MKLSSLNMENIKVNHNNNILHDRIKVPAIRQRESSSRVAAEKAFSEILYSEGCDSFIDYIEWLGFKNDPNMVVLSSKHHFYYDSEELRGVKTITNLKELNEMKHLQNFLHSVRNVLHRKGNFIGYFSDNALQRDFMSIFNTKNSKKKEFAFLRKISFLNLFYRLIGLGINKYMSRKSVRLLLEEHGFKVLNMTEINGRTYFHARIM